MTNTVVSILIPVPRYGVYELWSKKSHVQLKAQSVATQLDPPSSSLANVKNHITSSPPSEVVTPSVNKGEVASSASDDKVR
jgi:hypothetical protein